MTDAEFPVADVTEQNPRWFAPLSRMWWITAACVLIAIGLAWRSIDRSGPEIVIHFPDGHGLKPGDALRHRGIDIGHVESVRLNPSLDAIMVIAVLDPEASAIAREGSRFWIVRPQLDLTGVSGLETAVGAKYIAVIPGDSQVEKTEFDGLTSQPPESLGRGGMEIILRGDHRWGVNPGSPLTWRGVEVGQVLSSSLSPDALHVDTRVRVLDGYRHLLSRNSKFWVISGIHMGLDGLKFEVATDSLATIARGGIAFITPGPADSDDAVQPGDVFTLHEDKDDDWIESATALNLMRLTPPPVAAVVAKWKDKLFGIPRNHESHASALTIPTDQGAVVLLPSDLLSPLSSSDGAFQLIYQWQDQQHSVRMDTDVDAAGEIVELALDPAHVNPASLVANERLRVANKPEDCFAIRRSWHSDGDSAVVIEMISQHELVPTGNLWRCDNPKLGGDVWHGAAVIATEDEKVIGMLVSRDSPVVVPLPISRLED